MLLRVLACGERAGWAQKLSDKGWVCKTWVGELALVSLPGHPGQTLFTIWSDDVAQRVTRAMGKRVARHDEGKVGLPGSCFGGTRHYLRGITLSEDIPLAAGVSVQRPAPAAPSAPAASVALPAAPPASSR